MRQMVYGTESSLKDQSHENCQGLCDCNIHLRDGKTVPHLSFVGPDSILLQRATDVTMSSVILMIALQYVPHLPIFKKVAVKQSSVDCGDPDAFGRRSVPTTANETHHGGELRVGFILCRPGGRVSRWNIRNQIGGLRKSINKIGLCRQCPKADCRAARTSQSGGGLIKLPNSQ